MLKALQLLALAGALLAAVPCPVAAQALDPTFTPPASLYASGAVYSMAAQQADGKRVVAGYFTRVNNTTVGSLVRLDAAGVLDAAFAQNVGAARNTNRVKALPSGQYLVSGFYNDQVTAGGLTRTALLRLNASGLADATFNAGTGAVNNPASSLQINTFVGQPDGKVLVGGTFDSFSGQNTAGLVRLTSTGALDAAFNANLGTGFSGAVNTIVLQTDGKVLVGGSFTVLNGQAANSVVRLNADGTRDASFTSALVANSYVGTLLVQPDGRVLATGYLTIGTTTASIVRLLATGAADTGFAAPSLLTNYGGSYFDSNVALQPDGKILFSGPFQYGGGDYVARLNTNGTRDNTFLLTNGPSQYPFSMGLQSDGSLWLGGNFDTFGGRETPLGRVGSTGVADATFVPKVQAPGSATAVVRQADGQLILGGDFNEYNGMAVRHVVRLSATGAVDAAYVAATAPLAGRVSALALQPDGKLLVAGNPGLRRLLTTGATDASYGTFAAYAYAEALVVQPDGKLLVAGYLNPASGSPANPYLARLTTSGDNDPTFNAGATSGPGAISYLTAMALQPDGKVVVGGSFFQNSGAPDLRVVRYTSTGAVDATFSSATTFDVGPNANGGIVRFNTLAVQTDGKVLVGGFFATAGGAARANLARLSATGQLDAAFVPPATSPGAVTALALQPNGRVLVGSGFGNDGSVATTPLTRVLTSGAADPSFGPTTNPDNSVAALLVQPNGAIVLAGYFGTVGGVTSPGIARITAPNVLAVAAPAALAARLAAWPVPAHGVLHLAPDLAAAPRFAELADALGRTLKHQALSPTAAEAVLSLDGLPAGVYVLRVQYAAGLASRTIVVE